MEQEQQLCESHKPDLIWVRERRQGTVRALPLSYEVCSYKHMYRTEPRSKD
uniref:Uncharacterized protein n=1 Tax=Anguilla anguilla TaxID=7936 RepID=A0A0E9U568_ANGAN